MSSPFRAHRGVRSFRGRIPQPSMTQCQNFSSGWAGLHSIAACPLLSGLQQRRDGHQLKTAPAELIDDFGECFSGVPAATVGMHDDDRAVCGPAHDGGNDIGGEDVAIGIAGDDVPLNDAHPGGGNTFEDVFVVIAEGEAKEAGGMAVDGGEEFFGPVDLPGQGGSIDLAQVRMAPGMVAELEARLAGEKLCFLRVMLQPEATGKEGGGGLLLLQNSDDGGIEAGRFGRGFTEVEGQGDLRTATVAVRNEQRRLVPPERKAGEDEKGP